MKKTFDFDDTKLELWHNLVERALIHSDKLTFNILYVDKEEFKNLIQELGITITIKESSAKFYSSGDTLHVSLDGNNKILIERLKEFGYWRNKCIEDPSFWIDENEILASITHEDFVIVNMNYFGDLVDDEVLYDLTS